MVAYTTTYNLKKPTVADDEDVWGGYLNDSMDLIDDVLDGTTPVTGIDINSGTIDNAVIGGTTPVAGTFSTLTANTSLGVTGNITVSGTVDGRDVAADGTKLDGIESGATADQTKADIDALGINAATLDSLDSTQFLRSDASDSMSGQLLINNSTANPLEIQRSSQVGIELNDTSVGSRYLGVNGGNLRYGSNLDHSQNSLIWHSGNDGSGSGLDADTVDGIQASSFLRSDADDTTTGKLTVDNELRIENPSTVTHFNYNNGGTNYIRGNTFMEGTFDLNGNNIIDVEDIYLRDKLFHDGDTDTYLGFGTNTITLATGGSSEITVNTTGVRLGDTGNGYFQPVSGSYGSIQIDGGAHSGWEGYSIGGRAVFMHDNGVGTGIYNDVDNEWLIDFTHNGDTRLRNNGTTKVTIGSTYMEMAQHLDLNNYDIYGVDQIFHHGDTNTYMQFHASDQWRVVTGGSERLEVNNTRTFIDRLYVDAGVVEDYEGLSGTSVTCNVNNGGAFGLTMTGNTTFTFTAPWSTSDSVGFVLQLTGNGSTVTWPSSVDWAGGTAPDAPASGETDIYVFWTRNGGTTWYGVQSIDAAA